MSLASTRVPPSKVIFLWGQGRVLPINEQKFGGMSTVSSEIQEPDEIPVQERVPLSGEALAAAIAAMESPDFLSKLTARIMKEARKMGFQSPFDDSMDLPGGKSAADLAGDIVEKALAGAYTWNREKIPDFINFCRSRAQSILSNWLNRMKHFTAVSPMQEKDSKSGDLLPNPMLQAISSEDIYALLRFKDGSSLGDRFLVDFALNLPDESVEQRVIMAVVDDRECGNRAVCRSKLGISEADYDAAVKRLLRKLPIFGKEWRKENNIGPEDWKEAQ
jgi:hypothetical protein